MTNPATNENGFGARMRSHTQKLAAWTVGWLLTTALLAFGPKFLWNEMLSVTLIALAINLLVGLGVVLANKHYLSDLDDLHRKVMFDAMAVTLGVAMIVSVPWSLLERYDLIPVRDEIEHLLIVMGLTFVASVYLGLRRYR